MPSRTPSPISSAEHQSRLRRVRRIARKFGFTGQIEYRHSYTGSGGGKYEAGPNEKRDSLLIDAEAFVRDAKRDDFSLEAIIAHERGHQIVCRNHQLQRFLVGKVAPATEEILASLIGSWIVENDVDAQALVLKALHEALECGLTVPEATGFISELHALLRNVR